ncbi:hypothetical protein [Caballeronia sp. ATUFL_M2_KS44]|uniref:hypothetical protein n=1 Tax=Caballeronia sp. ATUFL_M2_KS44 TaxID=2921767 RepID=UPI002028564F|nr:hypothetical protein [Caballeronia sp. ATUFL_M2_KS44]
MDARRRFFNENELTGFCKAALATLSVLAYGGFRRPIPLESTQIYSFFMPSETVVPTEARRAAGSAAHDTLDRSLARIVAK